MNSSLGCFLILEATTVPRKYILTFFLGKIVRTRPRTERNSHEKGNKTMIIRRSPSPFPAHNHRTSSGISEPSSIRTDYKSYRQFHSQPPTPPAAPSPPLSPLFGQGSIAPIDEPGPWFHQNHQPYAAVAYSERGIAGSITQAWWDYDYSEIDQC
jgi:hypothetical protein